MRTQSEKRVRPLVMYKFGGSSVATPERLRDVAGQLAEASARGADVVVVVSAMGKTTNQLLDLARNVTAAPCPRELDMLLSSGERIAASLLSMALKERGLQAVSLTGRQAGILTDDAHARARVLDVRTDRIRKELSRGRIVVIAGYQGTNAAGDVTTLGRGGSDTSAVAFASALRADRCCICSDVDGVYTADPRVVPGARRLDEISYDEMLAMSRAGARVLNEKAVDLARRSETVILARSSFGDPGGTRIHAGTAGADLPGAVRVVSVAGSKGLLRIVAGAPVPAAVCRDLAALLEDQDVLFGEVDSALGMVDFVVSTKNVPEPRSFADSLTRRFPGIDVIRPLGSVSIIGRGIGADDSLEARARKALVAGGGAPVHRFAARHAITFLVPEANVEPGLRLLHRTFVEEGTWRGRPSFVPFGASRSGEPDVVGQ